MRHVQWPCPTGSCTSTKSSLPVSIIVNSDIIHIIPDKGKKINPLFPQRVYFFRYFFGARGRVMPLMLTLTLRTLQPVVDSTVEATASWTALATSTTEWP